MVFRLKPLSEEVTDEFTSTAVFFCGNGLFNHVVEILGKRETNYLTHKQCITLYEVSDYTSI